MARSSKGSKKMTQAKRDEAAKEEVTISRPNDKDYDPERDPMVVGFQVGTWVNDKILAAVGKKLKEDCTPYDFLTDPTTGMRPGETKKPNGTTELHLEKNGIGISAIPPLEIWKKGKWLADAWWTQSFKPEELSAMLRNKLDGLKWPAGNKVPEEIFQYWVVSGEGTPGNNYYRVYIVPEQVAYDETPKHPFMWTEKQKKGTYATGSSYGYGSSYGRPTPLSTPTKPPATSGMKTTQAPALPAGVRMRCTKCGHWFKPDDLPAHDKVCPGDSKDGVSDWAIMCVQECGCKTLDEVSQCKPGFPRPKKAIEVSKKTEVKAEENGSAEPKKGLVAVIDKDKEGEKA